MPSDPTLILEAPEIVQLSSWMAAFNRDLPTRVMTAISAGRGIVLVSSAGGVAPELQAVIAARLKAADLASLRLTAPLGALAALHAAIGEALPLSTSAGQPLIVLIDKAEALSVEVLRRLQALVGLRRAGQPVLHALLIATPALLPLLRQAGLGDLWEDATAHIRLVPELAACLPEPFAKTTPAARIETWLPPPDLPPVLAPQPAGTVRSALRWGLLAAGGLALTGYAAAWVFQAPAVPVAAPVRTIVTDAQTWQAIHPVMLPRLVMAPVSLPARIGTAALSPSAASDVGMAPLHVTIRYRRGDPAAATRAALLLSHLRQQGLLADGPLPASGAASRVGYGFVQDGAAAVDLANRLGLGAPHLSAPDPRGADLARPGGISIFIGARDPASVAKQAKGST